MSSATTFGVEDLMKLHRGFIERGQFKKLGRMIKIVLGELPRGVPLNLPAAELAAEGRTLDWFDRGPMIGLSPGEVDLLVTSPIPPLPPKRQAGVKLPEVTQAEIELAFRETGKWTPPRAPLVDQLPEDRGARRIKGSNILIFEPVHQVLFRPAGMLVFGEINAYTDEASKTVLTFAWDFDRGTGYFYGGRFIVIM